MSEATRKRTHRPPAVADANYFDIEESDPTLEKAPEWNGSLDALHAFICRRAEEGDPVRWNCLIKEFGGHYGRDAHYKISYAVDRLKVARRVRIDDSRIPERILPTRDIRPKQTVGDFKFGRIKA